MIHVQKNFFSFLQIFAKLVNISSIVFMFVLFLSLSLQSLFYMSIVIMYVLFNLHVLVNTNC